MLLLYFLKVSSDDDHLDITSAHFLVDRSETHDVSLRQLVLLRAHLGLLGFAIEVELLESQYERDH